MKHCVLGLCTLLWTSIAQAEVIQANEHGFQIRHSTTVQLPPDAAYRVMTSEIHRWWNPAHSWSGDSGHFSIAARAGGCWCETWTDANGQTHQVEHMRVAALRPGVMFRAIGGLGPLQGIASTGSMTWSFQALGDQGTTVQVDYLVAAWQADGMEGWAGPVDGVIAEQVQRYAAFINSGTPETP